VKSGGAKLVEAKNFKFGSKNSALEAELIKSKN